jgi:hypothetical protein
MISVRLINVIASSPPIRYLNMLQGDRLRPIMYYYGAMLHSLALLEQHALSVDRCDQMITEAAAGESSLKEDDNASYR